jgi:hypothetical protein
MLRHLLCQYDLNHEETSSKNQDLNWLVQLTLPAGNKIGTEQWKQEQTTTKRACSSEHQQ